MKSLILAITTFNRVEYLRRLINSFQSTYDRGFRWEIVVADDGSGDGTIEYLENLVVDDIPIQVIRNQRSGIHHQFNSILRTIEGRQFDVCFKADDDIEFIKSGWEKLYIDAIQKSGFGHLCFFDQDWRPEKILTPPVETPFLISFCKGIDVQGSFFTITPEVIRRVGYMDTENFGFRGVGHIDYTLRACRLGFNDPNNPFDAKDSHLYIRGQLGGYRSALPSELLTGLEDQNETQRKYALAQENRTYVPFRESTRQLDVVAEKEYLTRAVRSLESQKSWYESEIRRLKEWEVQQYGHLPRWYVKIGKIFKMLRK